MGLSTDTRHRHATQAFLGHHEAVQLNQFGKICGMLTYPPNLRGSNDSAHGILMLGGSEGGIHSLLAEYLATRGLLVLSVAYLSPQSDVYRPKVFSETEIDFGWRELPQHARMIDLHGIANAASILRNHPNTRGRGIALSGTSYGGMAALALASNFPGAFDAVAAWTPNLYVMRGVLLKSSNSASQELIDTVMSETALSINGEKYPPGGYSPESEFSFYKARIEVERNNAPTFIVSGGRDSVWYQQAQSSELPDNLNAEHIGRLITTSNSSLTERCFFKNYPNNGHCFLPPEVVSAECKHNQSLIDPWFKEALQTSGGESVEAIRKASYEAWDSFWHFLDKNLGRA